MRVCYSHAKDPKERPKEFKTERGQLRELLVLERVLADDAEDKTAHDAEKLFRDMEQMVRAAKTLQIRFDAIITGANSKKADDEKKIDAKKWHFAAELTDTGSIQVPRVRATLNQTTGDMR